MPKAEITGYIVNHEWDDGSGEEIKISSGQFDDTGPYVWVKSDGDDSFYFRAESWPLIRDKVDQLFEQMTEVRSEGSGTV